MKADAGSLTFTDGQRHSYINVTILRSANSTEGDRTFDVELLNPSGGASIGIASTVSVTLLAGTRAFGVFYFADHSLSVTVAEDLGGPVVEATFEVTITSTLLSFLYQLFNTKLKTGSGGLGAVWFDQSYSLFLVQVQLLFSLVSVRFGHSWRSSLVHLVIDTLACAFCE